MNKKQQLLYFLAEQLLLHNELPDIRLMCSQLSITTDEYTELLIQCSVEEMKSVFTVLTPIVLMNTFHQTTDSIAAQKLWSELFLKSTSLATSTEQNSVIVQFVDEPIKDENNTSSAFEEVLKLQQTQK